MKTSLISSAPCEQSNSLFYSSLRSQYSCQRHTLRPRGKVESKSRRLTLKEVQQRVDLIPAW